MSFDRSLHWNAPFAVALCVDMEIWEDDIDMAPTRGIESDDVPGWVKQPRHFVTFYKSYMKERAQTQADLISRSNRRDDFVSNFSAVKKTMDGIDKVIFLFSIALFVSGCLSISLYRCDSIYIKMQTDRYMEQIESVRSSDVLLLHTVV